MIVKRFLIRPPYGADMPNIGVPELVFAFIIPVAVLWIVIYTAVRAALRHSK